MNTEPQKEPKTGADSLLDDFALINQKAEEHGLGDEFIAAAAALSQRYDFSGGLIENVAHKTVASSLLEGRSLTLEEIEALCDEEPMKKAGTHIGFCV